MKSKLLSLVVISLFLVQQNKAQITVNTTALAPIGDFVKQATDSFPAVSIDPGAGGTNLSWNFSMLHTNKIDTLAFKVPGATPYSAPFSAANVGMVTDRNTFAYLQNNSTGLFAEGGAGRVNDPANHYLTETITPHSQMMQWPASYQGTWTDNYITTGMSAYNGSPSYDSVRLKYTTVSTVTYDAWGSITTPLGTFQTLRAFRHAYETDSLWVHISAADLWYLGIHSMDTLDTYDWWSNSSAQGFPVVTITKDPHTGVIKSVKWLMSSPAASGIEEFTAQQGFSVYPNPASDNIQVSLNGIEKATLTLFDMSGRIVRDSELVTDQLTTINTEKLVNGLYFLVITSKEGQRSARKITIAK